MKNVVHNVKSYCGWTSAQYSIVVYDMVTGVWHLHTISYQQYETYKLAATRISNQFSLCKHRHAKNEIYFEMSNHFQVICTILMDIFLFS